MPYANLTLRNPTPYADGLTTLNPVDYVWNRSTPANPRFNAYAGELAQYGIDPSSITQIPGYHDMYFNARTNDGQNIILGLGTPGDGGTWLPSTSIQQTPETSLGGLNWISNSEGDIIGRDEGMYDYGWRNMNIPINSGESTGGSQRSVWYVAPEGSQLLEPEFVEDRTDLFDTLGPMLVLAAATMGAGGIGNLFSGATEAGSLVGPATGSVAPGIPGVSEVFSVANPFAGVTASSLGGIGMPSNLSWDNLTSGTNLGELGSGTYGTSGSVSGTPYTDPFSTGSMTGVNGMTQLSPEAMQSIQEITGLDLASLGSGGTSSFMDMFNRIRESMPNISTNDALSVVGQLIGNNQLSNSTNDIIGDWLDEIRNASALSPEERAQLGDAAVNMLTTQAPQLLEDYRTRFNRSEGFGNDLMDFYNDPMSSGAFSSIADLASENVARRAGARGTMGSGSLQGNMLGALNKEAMGFADNMRNTLGTLYQGEQLPLGAMNAAANVGNVAGNLGNQQQNAISGFVTNVAAPAELMTNPVRTGIDTLYGRNTSQVQNPANNLISSGLDQLFRWMGS